MTLGLGAGGLTPTLERVRDTREVRQALEIALEASPGLVLARRAAGGLEEVPHLEEALMELFGIDPAQARDDLAEFVEKFDLHT